jgi:hypothetical protein
MTPVRSLRVDRLAVEVYRTRNEMGRAAAARAAAALRTGCGAERAVAAAEV